MAWLGRLRLRLHVGEKDGGQKQGNGREQPMVMRPHGLNLGFVGVPACRPEHREGAREV